MRRALVCTMVLSGLTMTSGCLSRAIKEGAGIALGAKGVCLPVNPPRFAEHDTSFAAYTHVELGQIADDFGSKVPAGFWPMLREEIENSLAEKGLKNPGGNQFGLNVRNDRPIPVFTHCSGDYQGGRNGDGGATNYGVWWEDGSIVDAPDRFEIILTGNATVDVTPRRMKQFVLKPGQTVEYRTELLGRVRPQDKVQSGQAVADANGLLTIPKINTRGRAKLIITRSAS